MRRVMLRCGIPGKKKNKDVTERGKRCKIINLAWRANVRVAFIWTKPDDRKKTKGGKKGGGKKMGKEIGSSAR